MKIFSKKLLVALSLVVLLSGCSSVKIMSDRDSSADFTKYQTYQYYGWAEESNKILNQLEQERIESSFGKEFNKRNLQFVEEGGDLLVTLFIVTEEKTRTSATTTNVGGYNVTYGYGGWYGHGPAYGWGGGTSHTTFDEYQYTVGTLVIDIYDVKEKRLIFESVAQGETHKNPKGQAERIQKIAAKMMKDFPIEPVE
jgi:hypothetical protein